MLSRVVIAVALVTCACKDKATETKSADPPPAQPTDTKPVVTKPAEPAPPPAPSAPEIACSLITSDEAAKLISAPVHHTPGSSELCWYHGEADTQSVLVQMFPNDAAKYEENRKTDVGGPGDKMLSGKGWKAYRRESGLIFGVLAKGTYVSVIAAVAPGSERPTPALVDAQIKAIVSRL
jgi:hypothetical protein